MRPTKRKFDELRKISIEPSPLKHADGSCLIKCGNTHVICAVTLDNSIPSFLRGQNQGWLTAEYGMLPSSTNQRMKREAAQGKVSGRTLEIQRLISRSLRSCVDLKALGEKQLVVDCDVINADGGTRTTAITGAYVALHLAVRALMKRGALKHNPLTMQIAAVSCGIYKGQAVIDLDYAEDSEAEVDANFVYASNGNLVEVQGTAEKKTFSTHQLTEMLSLASKATNELFLLQNQILLGL